MSNLNYFDKNYVICTSYMNLKPGERFYIGSKDDRACRFCGKSKPDVSFRLEAHAIPEFTGNKSLIAYDECDECNEFFSRMVEDHFAKYLGAQRTLSQIRGKKGIPSYKGTDGKSWISLEESGLKITGYEEDPIFEIDEDTKTLTITAHRQPYIPAAVFKCLVKMAISIAPRSVLPDFNHLCKWIREDDHTYASFPFRPLLVFEQFTPGPMPYNGVSLFLLKRKDSVEDVPFMQFVCAFGNSMYQIVLPMPDQDRQILNKQIQLSLFPIPFSENHEYGRTSIRQLDLSGYEIVKNEPQIMHMGFQFSEVQKPLNKAKQ